MNVLKTILNLWAYFEFLTKCSVSTDRLFRWSILLEIQINERLENFRRTSGAVCGLICNKNHVFRTQLVFRIIVLQSAGDKAVLNEH